VTIILVADFDFEIIKSEIKIIKLFFKLIPPNLNPRFNLGILSFKEGLRRGGGEGRD